jgi:hypothetical protein
VDTTLYITSYFEAKDKKPRLCGYIKINGANIKIMEAQSMYDVKHFMKREGFTNFKYGTPLGNLYKLQRVKEW